jgi:hypothetical protein
MLNKFEYFQPFWCYVDEQSLEESTGVCKRKYKLCVAVMPFISEVLYFFVSTSKNSTNPNLTFYVDENEWLNLVEKGKYLRGRAHFDIRRIVNESKDILTQKFTAGQIACVARLPDTKKDLIKQCFDNLRNQQNLSPYEQKNLKQIGDLLPDAILSQEARSFITHFNI